MGRYVDEERGLRTLACQRVSPSEIKTATAPLAQRILNLLAHQPNYSHDIAKKLNVHEQKIYYHMRKLEKAQLIRIERHEERAGARAKYYTLAAPGFAVLFDEPRPASRVSHLSDGHAKLLMPFVTNGSPDFLLIIGSPEGHGPQMARAKDASYALDLALFLGSFLEERPGTIMKLDTELRPQDWKRNLIIVGGPIVNTATAKVNASLPVRFSPDGKGIVAGKKTYDADEIGMIVKVANPFAKQKAIFIVAGRRQAGTRGAILTFLQHLDEVAALANAKGMLACVTQGRDLDADGAIDDGRIVQ